MTQPAQDMTERHARLLAEFSELGLSLARDLHENARAAESAEEKAQLANAFARLWRSVRLTVMLEARLEKERRLASRDDAAAEAKARETRAGERRSKVRYSLRAEIREACDDEDDAEDLFQALDERLETFTCEEIEDADLDEVVARLRDEFLGVALEDGAEAPDEVPPPVAGANPVGESAPPQPKCPALVQMRHGGWAPAPNSS